MHFSQLKNIKLNLEFFQESDWKKLGANVSQDNDIITIVSGGTPWAYVVKFRLQTSLFARFNEYLVFRVLLSEPASDSKFFISITNEKTHEIVEEVCISKGESEAFLVLSEQQGINLLGKDSCLLFRASGESSLSIASIDLVNLPS